MAVLLSQDQELIRRVVREFAEKELAPQATALDREARFPREDYAKMAPLGLLGLLVPHERGGAGTDTMSYVVALEEVARVSGTHAALLILHNAVLARLLDAVATPQQREALLAPTLAGTKLGSLAATEESGGSSLEDVLTLATPNKDGHVLRGSKAFVSLARVADFYVVLARTAEAGPTLFHVDAKAPGLHFTEAESKLGLRAVPLAEMYLNRAPAPAGAVLGKPGAALEALQEPLQLARLGVAASLVGLTQAALESSIDFARGRVQFGQPVIRFGGIRDFLADVQAELEAARAMTRAAAVLRDQGREYAQATLEARLLAHRIAVRGTRIAHKIHGGAGFMRDLPLERVSRDVRTLMHLWDAHDIVRARLADQFLG